MPGIYILLPVHNRKEITQKFVALLKKQSYQNFQLILIDDGSTDGTADAVMQELPSTKIIRGDGNWWWAGSLQQGLNFLKSQNMEHDPLVLFINDDVLFDSDYLQTAWLEMADQQAVLMLSQFIDAQGNIYETGIHADLDRLSFTVAESQEEINCLSTRGLFVHWRVLQVIGGFRPRLLPHYLSDYEFTLRAHAMGFKCMTSSRVLLTPDLSATGSHTAPSSSMLYLKTCFSKRYALNPWYWSMFICMTGTFINIPKNLMRIWMNAARNLIKTLTI